MRQLLPVVLAVAVLATTVAAGAAVAPQQGNDPADTSPSTAAATPVVPSPNTTGYLAAPADERQTSRFGNASLDVAGATALDSNRYRTRLLEATTLRAVEDAPNNTARTRAVRAAADEIANRTEALQRRQATAVREYNRGDISSTTFLREIAVVSARAAELRASIDRLLRTADEQPGYSPPIPLQTGLESLRAVPTLLQGPVRGQAAAAISGRAPRTLVYTETTANGVVLARVSGGRYVREAFLGERVALDADNQLTITSAFDQARSVYPWADDNRITTPSATGYGSTAVYRITIDHTQGRLITYIDGATTETFREIQRKRLGALPTRTVSVRNAELTLRANRTHETGPVELRVSDTDTGEPVDARLRLNGQFVGTTGQDGRLWTVQPTGPTAVNATTRDGRTVETTVLGG